MKITAVASPTPVVNVDEGHSAGVDRRAKAIAAASGQTVGQAQVQTSPEAQKEQANIKRIKMTTQRSPNRHETSAPEAAPTPEALAAETAPSDILAPVEQAQPSLEATDPESPQYVDLVKAKRALQAKEREIAAREAALTATPPATQASGYTRDQIKANALSILREAGVTNEELTEAVIREANDYGPGYSKLETELKALKEGLENQTKAMNEREQSAEKQALSLVQHDVEQLVAKGDEFEAIRAKGYAPKVVALIHKVFKEEGKLLDNAEAATLIENELINEAMKLGALKKVQTRLNPGSATQTAAKPGAPPTKTMKTLTNRDGSTSLSMSKRERAIAAMEGRLKQ